MVLLKLSKPLSLALLIGALSPVTIWANSIEQAEKAVRMQEFGKAAALYQDLAKQGNAEAQYKLGNLYIQGKGVTKNIPQAKQWLKKAAGQGLAEAQFGLAQLIKDEDPEQAKALLTLAAEQGHRPAKIHLERAAPSANRQSANAPFENQWFGAARNNDVPSLQALNKQKPAVALTDSHGRTALFYAIEAKADKALAWLISSGANVNQQDQYQTTPLQAAILRRSPEAFNALIKAGANTAITLKNGDTLLHYALRLEQFGFVAPLIKSGININQENKEGWTALDLAEYKKAPKTAASLKQQGAKNGSGWRTEKSTQDVQSVAKQLSNANLPPEALAVINDNEKLLRSLVAKDKGLLKTQLNDDSTLLILAIKHRKSKMVNTLLQLGSSVVATGYKGRSPLQTAVQENDIGIVKSLLAAGASPIQQDDDKQDAIATAIELEAESIADVLLDNLIGRSRSQSEIKAHLKASDVPVNQYILQAAQHGQDGVIDRLLPYASNELAVDSQGRNALWFATDRGNAKLILKLLKAGIAADHEDSLGRTPFIVAVDKSCLQCARQLLGFVNVNHQTQSGNTALMIAAAKGDALMASWLIQNKADVEIRNQRGNTAIMEAVNANSVDIVKHLIKADANVTRKNKLGFSAIDLAKETSPEMLELVKSKSVLGLF